MAKPHATETTAPGMKRYTRREFTRTASFAIGAASLARLLRAAPAPEQPGTAPDLRPNILFICADQWRRMAMSYYGDQRFEGTFNRGDPVHTPHMDKCAREGMIFHNAVTAWPICSPNRATLLTGLYPSTHGLILNKDYDKFAYSNRTIAHVLTQNGYNTAHIGKWHLTMLPNGALGRFHTTPGEKRGFEYWYGAPCHSHAHFDSSFFHAAGEVDGLGEYGPGGKPLPNPFLPSRDYANLNLRRRESWNPDHLTRKAIDYLKNTYGVRDSTKPFALHLSFDPPHTIHGAMPASDTVGSWHIAGKSASEYDYRTGTVGYRAPIEFEANYRTARRFTAPVKQGLPRRPNVPEQAVPNPAFSRGATERQLPGYFGAVDSIDACFGRIERYLAETPDPRCPKLTLKETTIVVLTSDHGEMMGSHGCMTKDVPLEESLGVPFVIRWPGHVPAGAENLTPFNSVDVAPSLLGLLRMRFPGPVDGSDRSAQFLGRSGDEAEVMAFCGYGNLWRAVRGRDVLYTVGQYGGRPADTAAGPLLFDMRNDPFQERPIRKGQGRDDEMRVLHEALRAHLARIKDPGFQLDPF